MTDTSITTSQTGNDVSLFDTVITWIEQGQTIWGALAFLAFIMVFAFCLINFRKKVNRISGNQIDAFVKVKKYIPSLYVELNDNMEQLRYFIFSYREMTLPPLMRSSFPFRDGSQNTIIFYISNRLICLVSGKLPNAPTCLRASITDDDAPAL